MANPFQPISNPWVSAWDTGGAWDAGFEWDNTVGPSIGDVSPYLDLVTSEHADKPKFMAMLSNALQPLADGLAAIASLPSLFDLDKAVGVQLDAVGIWVGQSRFIPSTLAGVYFSWDTAGVGWNAGSWFGPGSNISGLSALPDDAYRTLLRATIAENQWDGTIPGAYAVWNTVFTNVGYGILIQDLPGMNMLYALTGNVPDAVTLGLFLNGYLALKPAGVRINAFFTPAVANQPYFGFDVQNSSISGWDTGCWGVANPGI